MATNSMSIYLLKKGKSVEDALEDSQGYKEVATTGAGSSARMFVRQGKRKQPWWKEYFGVADDLPQQSSSAAAFIPRGARVFALTFGAGHFLIRDDAFDHEFGTRVVLNAVDPKKLKSTDTLDPDSSQRRRTQIPFDGDLALLSFTGDSSVLKSITGKAQDKYQELVRSVTGSTSLRVTTPAKPDELESLLDELLALSKSKKYRKTFPDIARIRPISDPTTVEELDSSLVAAIFDVGAPITLTVPDILDYADETSVSFSGLGPCEAYEDVYIKHYRQYLEANDRSADSLSVEDLKRHALVLLDGKDDPVRRWSIYRSLIFAVDLGASGYSYHLSDGTWYRVAATLVNQLRDYLDPYWVSATLPPHELASEGAYNEEVGKLQDMICLDKTNVSPAGQSAVEPCDLLRLGENGVEFIHVKLGTSSDTLSHLFNQGVNSMQLLKTDKAALERLKALVRARAESGVAEAAIDAIEQQRYSVSFAVVTHKTQLDRGSDNLPIFSRISLRRALVALQAMGVSANVQMVSDKTDRAGRKKVRKPRTSTKASD